MRRSVRRGGDRLVAVLPERWRAGLTRAADSRGARRAVRLARQHGAGLGVGLLALVLLVGAVLVPGVRAVDQHLVDRVVYVANGSESLVGTVNPQIGELASIASVGGENDFTIYQDDRTVLVHTNSNQLQRYTPETNQMGSPVNLPAGARVSAAAGRVAITNPANGKVWFRAISELRDDLQQARPALDVGEGGLAVVTSSGHLLGLNLRESVLVRPGDGDEELLKTPVPLGLTGTSQGVQLSAVGDRAVVYDATSQSVWHEQGRVDALATGGVARLADPLPELMGEADWHGLLATETGLQVLGRQGLTSLAEVTGRGTPATPVVAGECAYSALARSTPGSLGSLLKACRGHDPVALDITLPDPQSTSAQPPTPQLRFAVNGATVALNEVTTGQTWLVGEQLTPVPQGWARLQPPQQRAANTPVTGDDRQQRNRGQHPPVAADDDLGARAGRDTILDVLSNDSDLDGDVVTVVEAPDQLPGGITVQAVRGGAALQVSVPATASGSHSFRYTISDGRPGGTAQATVRLTIAPANPAAGNKPPVQLVIDRVLTVARKGQVSTRSLLDWRDPEGDDLVLVGATTKDPDDEVAFSADGTITYANKGKGSRSKSIDVQVSDGLATTRGVIGVQVSDKPVPPLAHADLYQLRIGGSLLATPLANDEGDDLRLTKVGDPVRAGTSGPSKGADGATVVLKSAQDAFSFTTTVAGTWYVPYTVASRTGASSTGLVRVDVSAKAQTNRPPVAARDLALMTGTGRVLVDPLANDTDPDGDVLVVESAEVLDPAAPIRVVLQQRQFVTIEAVRALDRPVAVRYWVSDGHEPEEGTIMVVPANPSGGTAQPITEPDELRVRAGTTGTAPVLANDHSPLGLPLHLTRLTDDADGRAWIDGDRVRVATAPSRSGDSFQVGYEVSDDRGLLRTGALTVQVSSSEGKNDAPTPQVVEARLLAGSTTRIRIPLDGIDPDGDPVRLVGLGGAPLKGRVTQVGDDWISYQAFDASSLTDSFAYRVMDAQGAIGTGEVRVGIAPKLATNQPPTAVADAVRVRPGRSVQVPVLANDFDVDGDAIGLAATDPAELGLPYQVVNTTDLAFTAPTRAGTVVGSYTLRDARGATARGAISVQVDAAAPLQPPVARDDVVPAQAVASREWVAVKVLGNDYDLDGRPGQLTLSVAPGPAGEGVGLVDASTLRVPVQDATRQFRYRITDADGLWAEAVVTVPGRDDQLPTLRPGAKLPLVVTAGQLARITVNDYAVGTHKRTLVVGSRNDVVATDGEATTDGREVHYTPDITGYGPAAVVVQVREQVGGDAKPPARTAWLTIPVEVKPAPSTTTTGKRKTTPVNLAPQGSAPTLSVEPGPRAAEVDIKPLFRDPELQDFHFEQWKAVSGDPSITFSTSSGGNVVRGQAPIDAKPGTKRVLRGVVVDAAGARAEVEMTLVVVKSTRPLPVATPDLVPDANAGATRTVDVLANDHSFVTPATLSLVGSPTLAQGRGTVKAQGSKVSITPDAGFHGTLVARYTIQDATGDPSRRVDGEVRVTVRSAPDRPGTPTEVSTGDGSATITWTVPADNGLPITRHVVEGIAADGRGTVRRECTSSNCTLTGLANGLGYRFQVTAHNALGASPTSLQSDLVTPDVVPEKPEAPTVAYGDKQLDVSWQPAATRGSEITGYELQLRSEAGTQTRAVGTKTSLQWTGLTNGTPYTFQVRAVNKKGPSAWSAASAAEHPSGPPAAPREVTARDTGQRAGETVEIAWQAPADDGGDPVDGYDVYATAGGKRSRIADDLPVAEGKQSLLWKDARNGTGYTFEVTAHNRAGDSASSAPSDELTPYEAPERPDNWAMTAGMNQVTLTRVPADDDPAAPIVGFDFYLTSGSYTSPTTRVPAAADGKVSVTVDDLEAGRSYVGHLVAIAQQPGGAEKASPVAESRGVTPWGQLGQVRISPGYAASGAGAPRTFRLTPLTEQQRIGVDKITYHYSLDGGPWVRVAPNEYVTVPTYGGASLRSRAWDHDHGVGGAISAARPLGTPLAISQDADDRVRLVLEGWPGQVVQCTVVEGGKTASTLPVALTGGRGTGVFDWAPAAPTSPPSPPGGTPPAAPPAPPVPPQSVPLAITCSSGSIIQVLPFTWNRS